MGLEERPGEFIHRREPPRLEMRVEGENRDESLNYICAVEAVCLGDRGERQFLLKL